LAVAQRVPIGKPLTEFPGATWNQLCELLERLDGFQPQTADLHADDRPQPPLRVTETATNNTGEFLHPFGIAALGKLASPLPPIVTSPPEDAAHNPDESLLVGKLFALLAPTTANLARLGRPVIVTRLPIEADQPGQVTVVGLTPVRIFRTDNAHTHARVADPAIEGEETIDAALFMVSAGGGIRVIEWALEDAVAPEDRLGYQWAIVELTGGDSQGFDKVVLTETVPEASWSSEGQILRPSTVTAGRLVPHAAIGTLTTRTDDETGTLTMDEAAHGIETGNIINLSWATGARNTITVGTVSGTSVPIGADDEGTGDDLPIATTEVTASIVGALMLDPDDTASVKNYFATEIEVTTGMGRIAKIRNGEIENVDCTEISLPEV
jgi:hypothetical protein